MHFQGSPGEVGWSCGYKNMQMQISHLLQQDKVLHSRPDPICQPVLAVVAANSGSHTPSTAFTSLECVSPCKSDKYAVARHGAAHDQLPCSL